MAKVPFISPVGYRWVFCRSGRPTCWAARMAEPERRLNSLILARLIRFSMVETGQLWHAAIVGAL